MVYGRGDQTDHNTGRVADFEAPNEERKVGKLDMKLIEKNLVELEGPFKPGFIPFCPKY